VTHFFESLFSSTGSDDMDAVIDHIPQKVTEEMNSMLNR